MKFILPISLIFISGALFFIVINPLYNDVSLLRQDVAQYNTALDSSKNLQKTLDSLIATYKTIKTEDKERLDHFLPNTVNNIKFILEMEQIASAHSMPIKDIKFEAPKSQTSSSNNGASSGVVVGDLSTSVPYGVFPISFTTSGDYDTFVLFLKDIESNLRLTDIKSVSFIVPPPSTGPGQTVNTNIYTYSLNVETYWLK